MTRLGSGAEPQFGQTAVWLDTRPALSFGLAARPFCNNFRLTGCHASAYTPVIFVVGHYHDLIWR